MDTPLTRWYCDVCGNPIEAASDGYVIWRHNDDFQDRDFKIIHQGQCDNDTFPSSSALVDFLGPDGQAKLLAFLSYGPLKPARGAEPPRIDMQDIDSFVDFFRRVQTPHYEEARRRFADPDLRDDFSDASEVLPYLQRTLLRIVE